MVIGGAGYNDTGWIIISNALEVIILSKIERRTLPQVLYVNFGLHSIYASLISTIHCVVLLLSTGYIAFTPRPSFVSLPSLRVFESL